MEKQKKLDNLRLKAMGLWVSYIREKDPKKGTSILRSWAKAMDKVHELQDEVNNAILSILQYS